MNTLELTGSEAAICLSPRLPFYACRNLEFAIHSNFNSGLSMMYGIDNELYTILTRCTMLLQAQVKLEEALAQVLQLPSPASMTVNLSLATFTFPLPQTLSEPAQSPAASASSSASRDVPISSASAISPAPMQPPHAQAPSSHDDQAAAPTHSTDLAQGPFPGDQPAAAPTLGMEPATRALLEGLAPGPASAPSSLSSKQPAALGPSFPGANMTSSDYPNSPPAAPNSPLSSPRSSSGGGTSPGDDTGDGSEDSGDGASRPGFDGRGQSVLQAWVVIAPPDRPGNVSFTAATAERLLDAALTARNPVGNMTFLEVLFVGREGLCGNGICEVGPIGYISLF